MNGLTIGEVARLAGVQPSTIRYYESLGLILPPRRVSNWRRYDHEVVGRLQVIRTARDLGFTLDEIQKLFDTYAHNTPPAEIWRGLSPRKLPEVQATIQRAAALELLLVNSAQCACGTIGECLATHCAPPSAQPSAG